MPIREQSFRIGCGRYLQGKGILAQCGAEILRLGKAPMLIGDDTTLGITREKIEPGIQAACRHYEFVVHNGTCNDESARALATYALENGYDVIVGIGGGVLMDFAKLCAHFAGLPIINVPTSSATCAAYAPLSVRYTPDGQTVGSKHYSYEVDGVVADTEILVAQPVRLLLSGAFDALAKFVEIKQRYKEDATDYPMGLDYAYVMAKHSYEVLNRRIPHCIAAMERGEITEDVEQVVFTAIAATGVISGIARGSNQTALGHKFYETVRFLFCEAAKPYLHGEIVGVGLLLQNHFNGEVENNEALLTLMKRHGMPYRVTDVGVPGDGDAMERVYTRLCESSAMEDADDEDRRRLWESLAYLWSIA